MTKSPWTTIRPFRLLITGSRDWDDPEFIWHRLNILHSKLSARPAVLVSGACPTGADRMCEAHWQSLGASPYSPFEVTLRGVERHPADWSQGKGAGFARNSLMVDLGANLCLAFWKNKSAGTADTIRKAQAAGIKTLVYKL